MTSRLLWLGWLLDIGLSPSLARVGRLRGSLPESPEEGHCLFARPETAGGLLKI